MPNEINALIFRDLKADEIELRVASINDKGLALLLYKDARCDMNILDETVGAFNWQRSHNRENANCIVSIWDQNKSQWISKEDTGTESNTEAQKGLASDSFKRACFNWGIGRELYTAPFIWISASDCNITTRNDGKRVCFDKFKVDSLAIKDKKITGLKIKNLTKKKIVFNFGECETAIDDLPDDPKAIFQELDKVIKTHGLNGEDIATMFNLSKTSTAADLKAALGYARGLVR